ncbi:hypothetical protein [Amnibacterium kyonggiense]|uniref:Uncharacterized protein n=1 Tax=Amnibacterium kyonggiense TaxID=595671 RepID=A0A4R7FRX7_9MICO|nr:hypothetical protein [Amnibacterium kyonggiense]TDS80516.1 hypothetical protein CLV52_1082 [Amnibacterium kyonggiense]
MREWAIRGGRVVVDEVSGGPRAIVADARPELRYLLDPAHERWHSDEHRWGSGFLISTGGSARWNVPERLRVDASGSVAEHRLLPDVTLTIERRVEDGALRETHRVANRGDRLLGIGSLGVVVPIHDVYDAAEISLAEAVHAHVWTGGGTGWLLAVPMSGDGPVLRLRLEEGRLGAYSIESRNEFTGSNVRGHLVLQPTDGARNETAFGGQRALLVPPGDETVLSWTIAIEPDAASAEAAVAPGWSVDRVAAEVGEAIRVAGTADVEAVDALEVRRDADGALLTARQPGVHHVDIAGTRTAVLLHPPIRELVLARIVAILGRHRSFERRGVDAAAFVPADATTGLTRLASGWPDWSDGAERVGMPALLQEARKRGWSDGAADDALREWLRFARERLIEPDGTARSGSSTLRPTTRLYDAPALAHLFAEQSVLDGSPEDLELAARVLERAEALGAGAHLSIGHPEAMLLVADLLAADGQQSRAEALEAAIHASADHFAALGTRLPAHEVNYEQSMVAPLVTLFARSYERRPDARVLAAMTEALRWMRAFGGPQPHVRLHRIGIRHWDGYWFGALRRWGDTFPHYWSVLSAIALERLPDGLRTPALDAEAEAIWRANLADFGADGSASCAFVLPSTVDGVPAHSPDPLANDQDWALALLLRSRTFAA